MCACRGGVVIFCEPVHFLFLSECHFAATDLEKIIVNSLEMLSESNFVYLLGCKNLQNIPTLLQGTYVRGFFTTTTSCLHSPQKEEKHRKDRGKPVEAQ